MQMQVEVAARTQLNSVQISSAQREGVSVTHIPYVCAHVCKFCGK